MFDKLKSMGAIAGLLGKKDQLRDAMDRVKDKMSLARVTGTGGQGAVKAVVSGKMQVISIELAPALAAGIAADDRTRELAGNLITEAVNDGLSKAQSLLKECVEAEAKALGLPGLPGLDELMRG